VLEAARVVNPVRTVAVLLALLQSTGGDASRGQDAEPRAWLESVVPRMASAEAQLGHARRLKREMNAKQGAELASWRRLAVEGYRAVRLFHPERRAACVEAAFRAGEILRAAGDGPGALAEFGWAARQGLDGEFRARARLEIGHLHRRALRWREALESYLEVAADPSAGAARREDAWLWAGTSWKRLGQPEDARNAWRRVAEQGTDPLARITGFDELALSLVEESELEGAAGILDQCLRALSASALEETEQGERVRNALLRMRVVDELPRAIARRNSVQADARNLER
jgi:tetratricopeptide (TPR) repeat protein